MLDTAITITNNNTKAKEAIIAATQKFWEIKREVWRERCKVVNTWEKKHKINSKDKKDQNSQKRINKTTQNKTQPTQLDKYIKETFKHLYIKLTNHALEETLTNSYYIQNIPSINISASRVLTH